MTLLELCGAAAFHLSDRETERWLHDFSKVYPVAVMDPFGAGAGPGLSWLGAWADDVTRYIARKMTFGDAILAREADRYAAEALVTWNREDFVGRTAVPVVTPDGYLADLSG